MDETTKVENPPEPQKPTPTQLKQSLEILSNYERNAIDVNEYVTSNYRKKGSCERYIFTPFRWLLSFLVIITILIDPIFVIVSSSLYLNIPAIVCGALSLVVIFGVCLSKKLTWIVLFFICNVVLRIIAICIRINEENQLVMISNIFSIVSVCLLVGFIIFEQVSECMHCKL